MMAQKKELSQARSYIKSGNYDGADQLMMNLLKDTANRANEKVYLTLYDAVRGKYNQGNEKFYLKQSLVLSTKTVKEKHLKVISTRLGAV